MDKKCGDESLRITAIGHSHLDLAWLWPIRETKRKGARTFSNVLRLMERYPDFVFGASQPQLYQWVKDGYPQLYSRVKKKVKENRWECQGAMWVEADTNISGAEPLVRQFLYGKKFFAEEFGVDARSLWLPDVFGYSAALPQIMKKSGVDYFVTQKLCWSQFDVYPHHTFWWQGIDGSQVLSHLLPENTYNGSAMPRSLKKIEKNYKDNAVCEEALMLFGIGDGAGGPSPFHLESLKRTKKLNGLVECEQGYSADMLDRIAEDTHGYKKWVGELYLERHQGTYTTQSRIKRFNRKTEFALRETEFACAWASRAAVFAYPQEELEAIWKEYLLYQFHDILPGSSINRVYKEAEERFEILLKRLNEIKKNAYRAVAEQYAEANESMVFNSLPFEVTTQLKTTAGYRKITVPAMGMTNLKECTDDLAPCVAQACVLENSKLRVLFNEQGEITSIFDLESEREVLQANANIFRVYNDRGDAWDMRVNYTDDAFETMRLDRCEWSVEGENAVCTQVFTYGASVLQQRVVLTQDGLVKFETKMDWRERDRMVRTAFPVDVLTNEVECDIQFGSVKRATNENTTWQYAQYEICAQKWVDLSQADYGAAVLNNGKYGYRCKDNVIDIDLLRSPSYPDVAADYGEHKFTYAFYPHRGNRMNSAVVRLAYQLNAPLTVVKTGETATGAEPALPRLFELNGDGSAVIESVKLAEDGKGIVVRLYETNGASCAFSLTPSFAFSRASEVDLMERELTECDTKNGTIHAKLKPFEIFSIKIS
ncbi:MAG TPA: alpha-mannosidase [Ruminococcaceae bacterium]|nr:alpha-mannosidase [Oscillospiraceae bacterium]